MPNWTCPAAHPFLVANLAQLEAARRKLAEGFEPVANALAELEKLSGQAADLELPGFDHSWFAGKTRADWAAIYPEVFRDTSQGPGRYAMPALGAALHWALTEEATSLAAAKRILLHMQAEYPFDIEHYDVGMNYTGFCIPLLWAYDLLYETFTPTERGLLDEFFARAYSAIAENDALWVREGIGGAYNNHYAWHKFFIASYGAFYGRGELIDFALTSPMGVDDFMAHGLVDDGLWLESATGYNFVAAHALLPLAWTLRNAGWPEDLFERDFGRGKRLRQLFDAALYLLFPDGSMPALGDCYGRLPTLPGDQYEYAWAIWKAPEYAWVVSQRPRRYSGWGLLPALFVAEPVSGLAEPPVGTRNWPEHGLTLLANNAPGPYFSPTTAACFITWGYSGIHGHADKLGFELAVGKRRWLADAEATSPGHSFSSDVQGQLNRTSLPHSLVTVDHKPQRGLRDNLTVVELDEVRRRLVLRDEGALYEGVTQQRAFQLGETALTDLYELSADTDHTFEYQLVFWPGTEITLPMPLSPAPPIKAGVEYTWLRDLASAPLPAGTFSFEAKQEEATLKVEMVAPEGSEVLLGSLPRTQDWQPPHFPLLLVRYRGKQARFEVTFTWAKPTGS